MSSETLGDFLGNLSEFFRDKSKECKVARVAIGDSVILGQQKPNFDVDSAIQDLVSEENIGHTTYTLAALYLGDPYAAETLGKKPRFDARLTSLEIKVVSSDKLEAALKTEVNRYLSLNKEDRDKYVSERDKFE
jgi:hypothetical protein